MAITITENELLEMPSQLLIELQTFLRTVRSKSSQETGLEDESVGSFLSRPRTHASSGIATPTDEGVDLSAAMQTDSVPALQDGDTWGPTADLKFTEQLTTGGTHYGLKVEQDGQNYLARRWRLTPKLKRIVNLALKYGFSKVWREGHPHAAFLTGGPKYRFGTHHIAFSRDHVERWVFAIDINAKPPDIDVVVFQKRKIQILEQVLERKLDPGEAMQPGKWKKEKGGGKNYFVHPSDVEIILEALNS